MIWRKSPSLENGFHGQEVNCKGATGHVESTVMPDGACRAGASAETEMEGQAKASARIPGWGKILITLIIIVGAGALVFTQLPRGAFSTDLSRIGQGTPALVVARDINFLAGAEVMDLLNTLRPEYGERVEFLAAHLGHPEGQAFARRHGMRDATVVVFAADGTRMAILHNPRSQDEVRGALSAVNMR
jgi:hypothetical protein